MRIDLHIHTTASHGSWSVQDVYEYVRRNDLERFSITEQDFPRTLHVPEDLRQRYIPGVEVACELNGRSVHLLVYGPIRSRGALSAALAQQRRRRMRRVEQILIRLAENNVVLPLTAILEEATVENRSLSAVHVARALVRYDFAYSVDDAFKGFLMPGRPAYVALECLSACDAIRMAHEENATIVAAHPARLESFSPLDELREAGIDGVEVYHPSADQQQIASLQQYATKWDLVETAGSDAVAVRPPANGMGYAIPG